MNRVTLLETLKAESETAVADLMLPVPMQKDDDDEPEDRAAHVYLMRVSEEKAAYRKTPYILHQVLTGKDAQPRGELTASSTVIRSIFAVYCEDAQMGGLHLLNLMERLRIHLLRKTIIGGCFELDREAGIETLVYPEETAPYFAGEMITVWKSPAIEREVREFL